MSLWCAIKTVAAQTDNDTINRIDFLNLNGQFIKKGAAYTDSAGSIYGILDKKICKWYYAEVVSNQAIVANSIIAEYDLKHNFITLYYPTEVIYIKFEKMSFYDFLKENTREGVLVDSEKLRLGGIKPKIYCTLNRRSYKLSKRCD